MKTPGVAKMGLRPPQNLLKELSVNASRSVADSFLISLERLYQQTVDTQEFTPDSRLKQPKRFLRESLRDLATSCYTG
ncbi:MAG: hypothetical protein ACRD3W_31310, partial [Terriglobales bacterium]